MGAGETNIGYGRFDHVRVPRFNMLNKNDKVTETGTNPHHPAPCRLDTKPFCRCRPLPLPSFPTPRIPICPASFSSASVVMA